NVNSVSALQIVRHFEANLARARGLVVLIGSTSGLENEGGHSVAYAASKFALRGAGHALREHFRSMGVRVSCINPGSIASDVPYGLAADALRRHRQKRIPV